VNTVESCDLTVDEVFFDLVAGIEELEDLTAPGWFNWNYFFAGAAVAGAVVAGIAIT
jgi:hypothetical protein